MLGRQAGHRWLEIARARLFSQSAARTEALLKRRRLGKTNLEVSEISLGTVEIGLDYGIPTPGRARRPHEDEAARLLRRALDLGINFIDTARAYGDSEAIIGRTLASRRGEFILASKVPLHERETLPSRELQEHCRKSVAESLQALQTDVIDVMMLHSGSPAILDREEVFDTLEGLRQAGSIRYIGASVYGMESARKAIESGRCDCIQLAYSLLDRRPEQGVLQRAAEKDVGVVARSVLLKGALTYRHRELPDELAPLRSAIEGLKNTVVCDDEALPELAYRWLLNSPPVRPMIHTALVGASSVEEVEAAVRFAESGPLPGEVISAIEQIAIDDENMLNPATWPIS